MTSRGIEKKVNWRRNDCDGEQIEFQVPIGSRSWCLQAIGNMGLELKWEVGAGALESDSWSRAYWPGATEDWKWWEHSASSGELTKLDAPTPTHWEGQVLPSLIAPHSVMGTGLTTWFENALYRRALRGQDPHAMFYKLTKNSLVH